jgi:hypothetical protein
MNNQKRPLSPVMKTFKKSMSVPTLEPIIGSPQMGLQNNLNSKSVKTQLITKNNTQTYGTLNK